MSAHGIDVLAWGGGRWAGAGTVTGWVAPLHKTTRRTKAAKSLYTKHRNTKWPPYQYKRANDGTSTNRIRPKVANAYANDTIKYSFKHKYCFGTSRYKSSFTTLWRTGGVLRIWNAFVAHFLRWQIFWIFRFCFFIGHNVWSEIRFALLST